MARPTLLTASATVAAAIACSVAAGATPREKLVTVGNPPFSFMAPASWAQHRYGTGSLVFSAEAPNFVAVLQVQVVTPAPSTSAFVGTLERSVLAHETNTSFASSSVRLPAGTSEELIARYTASVYGVKTPMTGFYYGVRRGQSLLVFAFSIQDHVLAAERPLVLETMKSLRLSA